MLSALLFGIVGVRGYCEGQWVDTTPSPPQRYRPFASRRSSDENTSLYDRSIAWMASACPLEEQRHSCYFNSNDLGNRAQLLEDRFWKPDQNDCLQYLPSHFLESVAGRNIVLYGDSTMAQVWTALVCSIYSVADVIPHLSWAGNLRNKEFSCIDHKKHCKLSSGTAVIRSANLTISYYETYGYDSRNFKPSISKMATDDIIIWNVGLHSNSFEDLRSNLEPLFVDIVGLMTSMLAPHLLFLETFPQHFHPTSEISNGYFWWPNESVKFNHCAPILNPSWHQFDWRNRVVEDLARKYNVRNVIIPIADGLHLQWDAHVEYSTVANNPNQIDCTHFCYPSGIFNFVLLKIYNFLLVQNVTILPDRYYPTKQVRGFDLDQSLVMGDSKSVYLVQNSARHEFPSLQALLNRGFQLEDVKRIPEVLMDFIPFGNPIY